MNEKAGIDESQITAKKGGQTDCGEPLYRITEDETSPEPFSICPKGGGQMGRIACYRCGYRSGDSAEFAVIEPHQLQWDTIEPITFCNQCVDESETLSDLRSNRES